MNFLRWTLAATGAVAAVASPAGIAGAIALVLIVLAVVIAVMAWLYTRAAPRDRKDLLALIRAIRGHPPHSS
jgi:Na+/melibiose symporter-like transporter